MRIQIRGLSAECCEKMRSFVKKIFVGLELLVQKAQLVFGEVTGFGQTRS